MSDFKLPDSSYSVSDIPHYNKYIKKKTLSTNLSIHIYINWINYGLELKIKDGQKLELQTPDTIKLFASTKKLIDETKNGENVPSFEIVLEHCNLVNNQHKQNPEVFYTQVFYTFTLNTSYAHFLNVEPCNLVFLKASNIEFDDIITLLTDQNGRKIEIEDKFSLTLPCLLINRNNTLFHKIISQRTRALSFAKNLSNKYGKNLSNVAEQRGLDTAKTASKKVVHKKLMQLNMRTDMK